MGYFFRRYWVFALLMFVAASLRLTNLGYDSFGHDESWRANWADHGGLAEARRMPPLKVVVLKGIQRVFGRSELALRFPHALAGIACVAAVYFFTRRYVNEGSAVLAASAAAVHPVLVSYSREIKAFSYESLMTVALMWTGYAAYHRCTRRNLAIFLLCAMCGLGFTYTGALVTAAWLPVLAWVCMRRSEEGRRSVGDFVAMVALFAMGCGACLAWYQGSAALEVLRDYYDVQEIAWPTAYTLPVLANWLVLSVKGAAMYILGITLDWPPLSWCAAAFQSLAAALALGVLWKRCRPACIVVAILAVEVIVAGAFRIWPLGRLRTVTFLVPIASIVIGCGMWQFVRRVGWSPAAAGFVGLCIGLPLVNAAKSTIIDPHVSEHLRPVIDHVRANVQPGDALFVYYGASDAFEYYADINEILRQPDNLGPPRFIRVEWGGVELPVQVQPVSDREDQPAFEHRFGDWVAQHDRVWFLFAHDWKGEHADWSAYLRSEYDVLDRIESHNASAHLVVSRDVAIAANPSALR